MTTGAAGWVVRLSGRAASPRRKLMIHRAVRFQVLLAPVLMLFAVFYVYPIVRMLAISFTAGRHSSFSLDQYQAVFTSSLYLSVIADTLRISAAATVGALLMGYPVAYLLARAKERAAGWLMTLLLLPFWTSLLVRTYAWMVLLQREGVVNTTLRQLGLIDRPLPTMFNEVGVLIGTTHILLPFMIFPIYSVLKGIDPDLAKAAAGLGAGPGQVFRKITLPLSLPGVGAGVMIVFISALGFFVTPALLGGGKVIVIAMTIEKLINDFVNWELAAALATVLLVVTALFVVLYERVLGTERMWS